ncbi:MAG: CopD family protein [Ramlibacter sp.]
MRNLLVFFHLAGAIFWMGGMAFMVLALRGPMGEQLAPPQRLPLAAAVLRRFFMVVAVSIAALLATGVPLLLAAPAGTAPLGWHAMAGLGLLMVMVFGHLFFGPYRRLRQAVAAADWPEGGKRMGQITLLAKINLGLGWLAIAAVLLWG